MSLDLESEQQEGEEEEALDAVRPAQPVGRKAVARKANTASLGGEKAPAPAVASIKQDAGDKIAEDDQAKAVDPATTAEEGFKGQAVPIPHLAQMQRSFGVSFAGVKAYTDEHARRSAGKIGAQAYAVGDRIAFASPTPPPEVVAHELTHVLQQGGHKAATRSDGGAANGVEVAGEKEAEAVEGAVAAGKPAKAALQGKGAPKDGAAKDPAKAAAGPAAAKPGAEGAAQEAAPAADKKAVARSEGPKFGTGMSFSPTSIEKGYSYNLWDGEIEIPIAAVPGLNLLLTPSVSVSAKGGVDWKDKKVTTAIGVDGGVGVGLSYGNAKVCSVYAKMDANVHGGFTYERTKGKTSCDNKWELHGGFAFGTAFNVGMKLGGGIIDTKFEFGKCDIGRLTGLQWTNGRFDRSKIGWNWGPGPREFFGVIKQLIAKAKWAMGLPKKAAKKAWKKVGGVAKGLGGIIKKIDLTPWDGVFPW